MKTRDDTHEPGISIPSRGTGWANVYRFGAIAALTFLLYSVITMAIVLTLGGPPENAGEVFDLLNQNLLRGLLRLDVLTILTMPFYYPLFLSLFIALRSQDKANTYIAGMFAFAGITLFLATPSAFPLIALSERFASSASSIEQTQLLAAGEALLAADMWHNTGAIIGGFLILIAGLIFSFIMLGDEHFNKWTAYVGITTHGLDLAHSLFALIVPQIAIVFIAVAGTLYLFWFPLLARDLFRLAARGPAKTKLNGN